MKGFVYIMSNPSFSDEIIKIGYSDRDPNHFRKNELDTTGVPTPFVVEYIAIVEEPYQIEKEVHSNLAEFRESKNREFFKCKLDKVINTIRSLSGTRLIYEEIYNNEIVENISGSSRAYVNRLCEVCEKSFKVHWQNKSSFEKCGECFRSNLKKEDVIKPVEKNSSMINWENNCEYCHKSFRVTITATDEFSVCPNCSYFNKI